MTVLRVTVPDQYFCTKHPPLPQWYTLLESHRSQVRFGSKLVRFKAFYKPSELWGPDRGRDGRDKAGPASGKNAGISHPEERAHHDVKSLRYLSFDTHSVILRKSTVSYFESPLLDMLIFIAHSLLSKTSWLSESTVRINLHYCNPYKVLVHSADVAAAQGCSCDSFSMTLCTFKHRKRICTYLSHIY